jgi:hypothetical protein
VIFTFLARGLAKRSKQGIKAITGVAIPSLWIKVLRFISLGFGLRFMLIILKYSWINVPMN